MIVRYGAACAISRNSLLQGHHCDTTIPHTPDRTMFLLKSWRQSGVHTSSSDVCEGCAHPLPDGKVTVWQGVDDATTTALPTATGVVFDQLLGQLDPEGLSIGRLGGAGVMLHQDVSICYSCI